MGLRSTRRKESGRWYKDDFGGIAGLKTFLMRHVSAGLARDLGNQSTEVEFFDCDWTLNDIGR